MPADLVWFARPSSERSLLEEQPRLASWEKADHPGRRTLDAYLAHVEELGRPRVEAVDGPLAVGLHVRLDEGVDLLRDRDLDNYALPVVTHLARTTGRLATTVFVTKDHQSPSALQVEAARPTAPMAAPVHVLTTHASSESESYKKQVDDALEAVEPLAAGPVALDLSFVVGPRRTWTNLWKPTIDALGRLLGASSPPRPWHPQDGRVVALGLHHVVDPDARDEVVIGLSASLVAEQDDERPVSGRTGSSTQSS